ncbi:hypothetical protein K7432_003337 [Basidiobolus ranarum]|uniref:Uncharacterized protein n=1 Tax=Basidiobolus ranarum TaxID=34480 RepID=A0ABR2X094_9FUNG
MGEQKSDSSQSKHSGVINSLESLRQIGSFHSQPPAVGRLGSIRARNYVKSETQKMKFVPTVPLKRNKKESTPSLLENAMSNKPEVAPTQRRGRGRGRGKGRGKDIISTASGPFSMGPATQGSKGFRGGAESSREILVGSSKNNIPAGSKSYKDKFDSFEYEDSDNEEDSFFVDQNEWTPIMLPTTNTEVKDESVDRLDTLMESHHEQNLSMDVDQEKLKPVHSLLSTITTEQKVGISPVWI